MRVNRYEVALWMAAIVLVLFPSLYLLSIDGSSLGDPACSGGQVSMDCGLVGVYAFATQARYELMAAGIVLAGLAISVRAVLAHLRPQPVGAAADAATAFEG